MNRLERRVRNMINPYSTAFATWWCHSARYWRLPRMITGSRTAARPGLPQPAAHPSGNAPAGFGRSFLPVFPAGAKSLPGAGQWTAREDGTPQYLVACQVSLADHGRIEAWVPARVGRASPRQRPAQVPARGSAAHHIALHSPHCMNVSPLNSVVSPPGRTEQPIICAGGHTWPRHQNRTDRRECALRLGR